MSDILVTLHHPDGAVHEVRCRPGQSILEAAEDAGLALPYSCRSAACASCAGKVLSGSVELDEQFILGDGDLAAGYTLLCSARPNGPCSVRTHQAGAVEGG
jgi:ferredoxin